MSGKRKATVSLEQLSAGFTDDELTTCLKVLDRLQNSPQVLTAAPLKALRARLHALAAATGARGGEQREQLAAVRAGHKAKNRKLQQQRAHDREFINNTALRDGRLKRLEQLKQEGANEAHSHMLIPDGVPALEGAAMVQSMLEGGVVGMPEDESTRRVAKDQEKEQGAVTEGVVTAAPTLAAEGQQLQQQELHAARSCYTCKRRFSTLHAFYDQLCAPCAALNFRKRNQTAELSGRVAVLTGARVKIGYQTGLKLLRCGATLVATTRFPHDASVRYAAEADYATWQDRLHVVGLDLRDVGSVEAFCQFMAATFGSVDIVVNNACQTVRRPAAYYAPLVKEEVRYIRRVQRNGVSATLPTLAANATFEAERQRSLQQTATLSSAPTLHAASCSSTAALASAAATLADADTGLAEACGGGNSTMTAGLGRAAAAAGLSGVSMSALMSQLALLPEDSGWDAATLPSGARDVNGQQLDLRSTNSWLLKLDQVSTPELVEVMFVNAVSPFVLNSRLQPLMVGAGVAARDRYIVNVSAMEGKFYRYKTPNHPHTNMAKAALNMMTRTSAEALSKQRVYMNAVDTGWINDENPLEKARKIAEQHNFQTPIDEVDAAARILDPVFDGINSGTNVWGQFLKDYGPTEW